MRGVSARSLDTLLSATDAAVRGGADAGVTGDELFATVALLDGAPPLRRVLTDPATDAAGKEQLARSILGGKVDAVTLDLVAAAVRERWSSARDLTDAFERAGVEAHVAGADARNGLDELEDELFRFGRYVAGDVELRSVLTDRSVAAARKQPLIDRLLDGKASSTAVALAKQAVVARRQGFESTLEDFGAIAAARRRRLVATARVAYALGDAEKQRLADALSRQYGREVHVNLVVDPSVLGGISVEIGEEIIDATVSSRLEDARRRIAG